MKQLWVFAVLIWYICVNENYLFTRAYYLRTSFNFNEKSMSISCHNSTLIHIENIYVGEESVPCNKDVCSLKDVDIRSIHDTCNGRNTCEQNMKWTSSCIQEYGYYNISYICNATCDFEQSLCGFNRPSVRPLWKRKTGKMITVQINNTSTKIPDHTSNSLNGYYMVVKLEGNDNATMKTQPFHHVGIMCLSFWCFSFGNGNAALYILQRNITFRRIEFRKGIIWQFFQMEIDMKNSDYITFQTNHVYGEEVLFGLDDVSIVNYAGCSDRVVPIVKSCISMGISFTVPECPTYFLNNLNINLNNLSRDDESSQACPDNTDIAKTIQTQCATNKWDYCSFNLSTIISDTSCLYLDKDLNIEYTCGGNAENVSSAWDLTTHQLKNTKDSTILTTTDGQPVSTLLQTEAGIPSSSASSTPVIGVVTGVVLSLVVLSVCLIIAVIYVRRYRYAEKKGHSIVANEDSHSDYTGHQNTAFSTEINVTTQTDYSEIRISKHNDQYHDISDTFSPSINTTNDDEYSEIANIVNSPNNNQNTSTNYQHQYISLDPNATGFDRSNQQTKLHNESKNEHNFNETTSFTGGDDYAILDPDDLNESKNNTPKVLPLSENYVVLDPKETGFNRQESMDTVCNYELATPINPTETFEDPYDVSKDETYDASCNSRHKEKENNIYSHMVDNVYDTAGNQRKKEESDATYDHFFGQQSEDDYDISKPL